MGEFKQTVWNSKMIKKESWKREISKNWSNILDWSTKPQIGSPLRKSKWVKSTWKGNYSVKWVGGGYVRELSPEENSWEEEKKIKQNSIASYSNQLRKTQFEQSKIRASKC